MIAGRAIHAVLFDMDGLLFDTEQLFFEAMQAAGAEAGRVVPPALYHSLIGHTRERNFAILRDHYGSAFPAEEFHALCHRHMDRLVADGLRLKPGVAELLDQLDAAGLPRALVTSSRRASVDHHLGAFNLEHRFNTVVAHGDYASGKPHPEPYLLAAARLGVDPAACLALEDSYNGIRSAHGAGTVAVMVPDLLPATDEMRALAAAILPDLHAVGELLTTVLRTNA